MKKTSLYKKHIEKNARMVSFAGWEMPLQYTSIIKEHESVRRQAGFFDVSHMGKIAAAGPDAAFLLQHLTCNDLEKIKIGQAQYNLILNEEGGVVDDILIYRTDSAVFLVVCNAVNQEKVYAHLQAFNKKLGFSVQISNETERQQQIAVQGPQSSSILSEILQEDLHSLAYFHFRDLVNNEHRLRVSRTGYTGEDGFEVYAQADTAVWLWEKLTEREKKGELLPVGLGARDSLRLEAFYPLYGQELNDKWTPVESGLAWCVSLQKFSYLGYDQVHEHKKKGAPGAIMGFQLEEGLARSGCAVWNETGKKISRVLSAAYSPVLKKGIGSLYLPRECEGLSTVQIEVRGRRLQACLQNQPFVQVRAGKVWHGKSAQG